MNNQRYFIIGAGFFGRQALSALSLQGHDSRIILVDKSALCLQQLDLNRFQGTIVQSEGVAYLGRNLTAGSDCWVIPTVPIHLAFEWIRFMLQGRLDLEMVEPEEDILKQLPNPCRGDRGQVFTSYADFRCPVNCPESKNICMHTGKPRPENLFDRIAGLSQSGFRVRVIRSRQLAPGVGGYLSSDLFEALSDVSAGGGFILATACRCHGVLDIFRAVPRLKQEAAGKRNMAPEKI